jgi:hypothetical protein
VWLSSNLQLNDRESTRANFACANSVTKTRRAKPGKFPDILGGRLGAGHDFGIAHAVKGVLISKFASGVDSAHDRRKILIRADIIAIGPGGILKLVTRQTDRDRLIGCTRAGAIVNAFSGATKARDRFGCNGGQLFENKIDVGITRRTTRQPTQRLPLKFSFTTLALSQQSEVRPRQRRTQEGADGTLASLIH